VRVALEAYCREIGFDENASHEVGLVVNEALANIMRHAYDGAADKPIDVTAEPSPDGSEIRIEIRDWGRRFEPRDLPDTKHDPLQPGGLGLICMRRMMDAVEYLPQSDGTLLRMIRRRAHAPVGEAPPART
jgi:anti-sigma regulatory factor (Ser/Thr protein kinase)